MTEKLKVGLIFGGRSGEHEISLLSARSVMDALDRSKYEVYQIGITHQGHWFSGQEVLEAFERDQVEHLKAVTILAEPGMGGFFRWAEG